MLNQLKAGLRVAPDERQEKPDELKKYEQMKALGLPVWAGGVQDQPHIWLEMIGVIENTMKLFETLARTSEQQAQPK
jgi:hypothetical protein